MVLELVIEVLSYADYIILTRVFSRTEIILKIVLATQLLRYRL